MKENHIHSEYIGRTFLYGRGKEPKRLATITDVHVTRSHQTGGVLNVEYAIVFLFCGQEIKTTVPLATITLALPFTDNPE